MVEQKTIDFVKSAKAAGISDSDIKNTLVTKQLTEQEISGLLYPAAPVNNSVGNNSMWDTFEHFLMFFSMLIFVVSIGLLWHYFIDKWVPQNSTTASMWYMDNYYSMLVKGYLASVIVSLPFFTLLFLKITKKTREHPELRNLNSRKTLIYLTLAVTFIILISNVISLVFNFLGGNIGINFILHFLLTLLINGVLFAYYLNQVKEDRKLNV